MSIREPDIEKTKKKPQNRGIRNSREAALELLHALFQHPEEGTPLPVMLAKFVQSCGFDGRDSALLSELTFGVLRRHTLLDSLLDGFLKKPGALSAQVRMLLRLGLYELLFMDGIPARATVSEFVGIARRRFGQALGGLVNGVLRSADRELETLRSKVEKADTFEAASIPAWLMTMWKAHYGEETACSFAGNTLSHAAPAGE